MIALSVKSSVRTGEEVLPITTSLGVPVVVKGTEGDERSVVVGTRNRTEFGHSGTSVHSASYDRTPRRRNSCSADG